MPNASPVAVISDGLWHRRYGADSSVIGRALDYDQRQFTIVGVAPRGFEYPSGIEMWSAVSPFLTSIQSDTAPGSLDMVARLRPDATMEQGRREFDAFLDRAYAGWRGNVGRFEATARTLSTFLVGDVRPAVLTLSAAAALVLFIACMNVATLLLVRGVTRGREVAIRASLGAARGRIVRQLLTESALLGVGGCAVGVGIAALGVRALTRLAPPGVPRLGQVHVDVDAVLFASVAAMMAVALFGLGPALALAREDLAALLQRGGSRSATGSRGWARAKQLLIVAQAALAVLVLTGAGLLGRSLINLQRVDLGFERERVVVAQLTVPWSKFATADGTDRFTLLLDELSEAARSLPGVASVAVAASPPYSGTGGWDALPHVEGVGAAQRLRLPWVNLEIVTSAYFETLGVPLVRGRLLAAADRKASVPVAIVNETMARQYWATGDAIGKRFRLGAPNDTTRPAYTVVGVVGDMRYRQLETAMPSVYVPNTQYPNGAPTFFLIRTTAPSALLVPALRRAFLATDPDAAVLSVRTIDDYLAAPLARPRFSSVLLAVFAAVALLLVAGGIYAVVAEHVRHHRRELGIRLALGAQPSGVRRMMLAAGLWPVLIGTAVGTSLTVASVRVIESQLYGVPPIDPITFGGVAGVVLAVAALACAVPARLAARTNPLEVLQSD